MSELWHRPVRAVKGSGRLAKIIEDFYPDLTVEDIRACVRYAIKLAETEEVHISAGPPICHMAGYVSDARQIDCRGERARGRPYCL